MFDNEGLLELEEESKELWAKEYPVARFGPKAIPEKRYGYCKLWKDLVNNANPNRSKDEINPLICGKHAADPRLQGHANVDTRRVALDKVSVQDMGHIPTVPEVTSVQHLDRLYAVAQSDRDWFANFLAAHGGRSEFDTETLQKFQIGYQKYLYLLTKYPLKMEWIGFSPTPSIDLFWHSHLLNPTAYFHDLEKLTFGVPHHKLLPEAARHEFVYELHQNAETNLWFEEFQEGLDEYLSDDKKPFSKKKQPETLLPRKNEEF
jgi:hypothetical protein